MDRGELLSRDCSSPASQPGGRATSRPASQPSGQTPSLRGLTNASGRPQSTGPIMPVGFRQGALSGSLSHRAPRPQPLEGETRDHLASMARRFSAVRKVASKGFVHPSHIEMACSAEDQRRTVLGMYTTFMRQRHVNAPRNGGKDTVQRPLLPRQTRNSASCAGKEWRRRPSCWH